MAGFAIAETAQEYWKEYRKHPVSGCFFCEFEQFYFNTSKHSSEVLDTTEHAFVNGKFDFWEESSMMKQRVREQLTEYHS